MTPTPTNPRHTVILTPFEAFSCRGFSTHRLSGQEGKLPYQDETTCRQFQKRLPAFVALGSIHIALFEIINELFSSEPGPLLEADHPVGQRRRITVLAKMMQI